MPPQRRAISEYRGVWVFAMFDLPVDGAEERRRYARFRKELIKEGFAMLQFSVYARYFGSEDASLVNRRRIEASLPPDGQVRLLLVTDHQFGKMEVFEGKRRVRSEDKPAQLLLF